jgi:hypothetical protein
MNTKKSNIILLVAIFLFGNAALAQFNKPLQSATNKNGYSEARYNIGISGGITSTYWAHFGGTQTHYNAPFNFGLTGGLVIERMFNANSSLSLEGYFAMRNTQLNYYVLNYPINMGLGPEHNKDYYRQLDAKYQEVNMQVLLTRYFSQGNIRPYAFVAPRVTVPLSGNMVWQRTQVSKYGTANQQLIESTRDIDTVMMTAQNTWQSSLGLVIGGGVMFRINVSNYYFIVKADVSAHAALAHFTFAQDKPQLRASFLNSYTYEETHGTSQNVIGAGYIDPYLLGMRINTDAAAKITIMFPLKKQLKGACMKWGEYD